MRWALPTGRHLSDYAGAISVDTRALMRVHTSNYRVIGFHADVALEDMARLAHEHGLPLLEDGERGVC